MYDYKPLINVITSGLRTELDNNILKAVMDIAIDVDKDELIKALTYDRNQYDKGFSDATPKWIPCSERLPKSYEWVLCTLDLDDDISMMMVLQRAGDSMWIDIGDNLACDFDMVIAWMPLPEPYKKEED